MSSFKSNATEDVKGPESLNFHKPRIPKTSKMTSSSSTDVRKDSTMQLLQQRQSKVFKHYQGNQPAMLRYLQSLATAATKAKNHENLLKSPGPGATQGSTFITLPVPSRTHIFFSDLFHNRLVACDAGHKNQLFTNLP